jgi:hypothetical protein
MTSEKSKEEEREDRLRRLLLHMFSVDELRRFIRFMPGGHDLTFELPAPTASPSATAAAIVVALKDRKAIDRALFDRLVNERPRREPEIREVQGLFEETQGTAENDDNVVRFGRDRG